MNTAAFVALSMACAPLVHPSTSHALVAIESGFNAHAIGVVGGSLVRQPRDLNEALATARSLRAMGRNFSVGLAQINIRNLDRLGLSLVDGFDPCKNLSAMQLVLVACYERTVSATGSQTALRRALSCYYSGNFATGFRHGYVKRVVDAAGLAARAPP